MPQKIFGWILLTAGVLLIGWGIINSINIFTAKKAAPAIFKITEQTLTATQKGVTEIDLQSQLQAQMQQAVGEQLKGILPVDSLPKLFNLLAWSIFMGILVFAGGQISGIGIKLLSAGKNRDKMEIK